ncbi:MAG: hypothetical protein U1E75_00665 [Alicycliphilus sp.]
MLKAGSSLDTCSLFYFSCINALNPSGALGLLLPEPFFNVATYEDTRVSALSFQIERLSHYGKPFKGLLTGAARNSSPQEELQSSERNRLRFTKKKIFKRNGISFQKNPKSIFNISCTADDAEVIEHIYSIPHITLSGERSGDLV